MSIESLINYSREEKIQQFLMFLKDPEIQPVFRNYIENILATSELKILKRLAAVEATLGLNDFADFEEEHELAIPEQLSLLAERIDTITEPVKEPFRETVNIATSETEVRACLLVEHLKDTKERAGTKELERNNLRNAFFNSNEIMEQRVKSFKYSVKIESSCFAAGTKFLTSEEIVHFLRYEIDEFYRVKEGQNVRQIKKEVLEKARKLFLNNIFLSHKTQGRKNVRIVYRP